VPFHRDVLKLDAGGERFTFFNDGPAASSITDIYFDDGTLIGIHVPGFDGGESESFVNNPVPEGSTALLLRMVFSVSWRNRDFLRLDLHVAYARNGLGEIPDAPFIAEL